MLVPGAAADGLSARSTVAAAAAGAAASTDFPVTRPNVARTNAASKTAAEARPLPITPSLVMRRNLAIFRPDQASLNPRKNGPRAQR